MMNLNNEFYNTMKDISDEEYLDLLCRAENEPIINGVSMPVFPDTLFQMNTVGVSGEDALRNEGFPFYKYIKEHAEYYNATVDEKNCILEFGCGWGRMIRFFFKDIPSENIWGIDTYSKMIELCKETLPCGSYYKNNPGPPTQFEKNSFDIVFAFSVFSHLRDDVADKWISEFSRILKPGGLLIVTVRGMEYLRHCEYLSNHPEETEGNEYAKVLSQLYSPIEEYRRMYLNGEFIYKPTGGGEELDSSFYGEAIIPKKYIEKNWNKYFKLRRYDENLLPQIIVVLEKRSLVHKLKRFIKRFTKRNSFKG